MQDWMFEIGGDLLAPAIMPEPWLEGLAQGVWAPVADAPLEPWLDPRFEASAPKGALASTTAIAWMIEDDAPLSVTTTAAAVETTASTDAVAPAPVDVIHGLNPLFVQNDEEGDEPYDLGDIIIVRPPNTNNGGPTAPPPPPWTPPPPPPPPVDPSGPGGGGNGSDDGHVYINHSQVGDTSCDADEAWQGLLQNAAPGQSSPATTGMIVNVPGLGPIVQTVNWEAMTVTNTTMPGHALFPGIVTRHVVSYGGTIVIETFGYGLGAAGALNSFFAGDLWKSMDLLIAIHVDQNDDGEGDC